MMIAIVVADGPHRPGEDDLAMFRRVVRQARRRRRLAVLRWAADTVLGVCIGAAIADLTSHPSRQPQRPHASG